MLRKILLSTIMLMALQPPAWANRVIASALPEAAVVGEGRLTFMLWDVYDATLYAPKGRWQPSEPYALSIRYFRYISGKDIADRSVQEMRHQGFSDEVTLAAWHTQMRAIFPDVDDGTVLSAVFIPHKETIFYRDDEVLGIIKGHEFGERFFSIWLSERTSEPHLRKKLLGLL